MGRRGREEGREQEERGGEGEEGRGMRRREGLNKKRRGGQRKREEKGKGELRMANCDLCAPQDLSNDYYCGCVMGWEGKNCSVETNECVNRPCLNGATCNVS